MDTHNLKYAIITVLALTTFCFTGVTGKTASKDGKASLFATLPYVTNVSQTSFDVVFRTMDKAMCFLEVGMDDGTVWYKQEHRRYYDDRLGRHFVGYEHRISVGDLTPGVQYRYRVFVCQVQDDTNAYKYSFENPVAWNPTWGTGVHYARTCTVRTLDSKADSCRFSMVCDMHFDAAKYHTLMDNMPKGNDFIMLCGDIVSHSSSIDTVLKYTLEPIERLSCVYPLFYARGNHDGRGADWYRLPEFFPTNTGEFYYTFRHGPVAFVVLDAGEDKPDSDIEYSGTASYDSYRQGELQWLKKAVNDAEFKSAPFKVCIIHIPTLSSDNSWYSQDWICRNFVPVLEKAGIDLMLSGHHHKYIFSKEKEDGCSYPVIVNSNAERLDFVATSKSITVNTFDKDNNPVHSMVTGK